MPTDPTPRDLARPDADMAAECERLRASKDGAYAERDKLVALLASVFPSALSRHPDEDTSWEDDWRWIVYVELPTGQASWHIHDSELPLFEHVTRRHVEWDGHTTEEKYERVMRARGVVCTVSTKVHAKAIVRIADLLAENERLEAELRAAREIVQARDAKLEDMRAERIARTATRGGIIDDLTRRAVAAERVVEAALELRDAAAAMVKATEEWNAAVESIIGRQPGTLIDLPRVRTALALFDAAGEGR